MHKPNITVNDFLLVTRDFELLPVFKKADHFSLQSDLNMP